MLYWFLGALGVLTLAAVGLLLAVLARLSHLSETVRGVQQAARTIAEHWADESNGGGLQDELRVLLRRLGNIIADLEGIVPSLRKAARKMDDAVDDLQEVVQEVEGSG